MSAKERLIRLIVLMTEDEAEAVLARYTAGGHTLSGECFSGAEFGRAIVASLSVARRGELLNAVDDRA